MLIVLFSLAASLLPLAAQTTPQSDRVLIRRYVEGDRLSYLMKGLNNGKSYEVRIVGTVKKGGDGRLVDEFAWTDLTENGAPRSLSAMSQAFRMAITLEGGAPFLLPDLSQARQFIGPVTDLMTFYADLFLAMHAGVVRQAGDHFRFANPSTSSWADGVGVLIGEDHIDFDITLTAVDTAAGVASLLVRHVVPAQPKIRLVADWMRPPVADSPNNWVQVQKTPAGYEGSIGKETFDVKLEVGLSDGKILSATMENPVTAIARDCSDAALTQCGAARPNPALRHVEMALSRE